MSHESDQSSLKRKRKPSRAKLASLSNNEDATVPKTAKPGKTADWTPQNLLDLYEYFKKNGFQGNWDVFANVFPAYKPYNAKTLVNRLSREVSFLNTRELQGADLAVRLKHTNAPIEEWMTLIFPTRTSMDHINDLPRMVEYISKYDKHPDPKDCGDVDYAAIYQYLADLMQGNIPRELSPASARKVLEMLQNIVAVIRDKAPLYKKFVQENAKFPTNFDRHTVKSKELQNRRRGEWSNEELEDLETLASGNLAKALQVFLKRPGFNPLNFPATLQNT